jgi:HSP20 family protein
MANNLYNVGKNYIIMITLFKDPFFNTMDDVFESSRFKTLPQVNVTKNETEYKVLMSVPGLTKEDLKITIKDGIVKISYLKEDKDETSHFVNSFTKSYTLPENVKEKDIEGKVENGILELTLPLDKKKPLERILSLN